MCPLEISCFADRTKVCTAPNKNMAQVQPKYDYRPQAALGLGLDLAEKCKNIPYTW